MIIPKQQQNNEINMKPKLMEGIKKKNIYIYKH